jgi:ferredoxin
MISVPESVAVESRGLPEKVPSLFMVDSENKLHLVLVDGKLIREARRCREQWRSLQELGGIRNSHAERLLEKERQAWEERLANEASAARAREALVPEATPVAAQESAEPASTPVTAAAAPAPAAEAKRPDEAHIDTARCTSCNECMKVNDRMFKYDGNKQAYIADLKAGTYADLVTAAENCQVAIIHPGKPWNPNEPGLQELLKRAEAFR